MTKRKKCSHKGCDNLVNREGLCYAHWYFKKQDIIWPEWTDR